MKHCRNGWKEKCLKMYDDNVDYECCPYCGNMIVMSLPYKEYFKPYIEFASNFFGDTNDDILDLIKNLEDNYAINIMVTEIQEPYEDDEDDDWYAATLTFETTDKTDIDKLNKDIDIYKPDEFDDVSKMIAYRNRREGITYRIWWD